MSKNKPVLVGRYVMFDAPLLLYLDKTTQDSNAEFSWTESSFITVTVGGSSDSWPVVLNGLLHELVEVAFSLRRCEFQPASALSQISADSYLFVARHHEFSEIIRHVSDALAYALPALQRVWKKTKGARGE